MPVYAYVCEFCEHCFEEWHRMADPHPDRCPECFATEPEFHQDFMSYQTIGIAYSSTPKTLGQQAEVNARRMGKEQMQKMAEEEMANLRDRPGSGLPGHKPVKKSKERPWWRKTDKVLDVSKIKDVRKYVEEGQS